MLNAEKLVLRCYATCENGQWTAVCIDLSLAAQSDSLHDAKHRLDAQIRSYIHDALVGPDRLYAHQLLKRKAPLSQVARYYWLNTRIWMHKNIPALKRLTKKRRHTTFHDTLPLQPA